MAVLGAGPCRRATGRLIVHTGWESQHPPPVWLDPDQREAVSPADPASGETWRLCQDDAALAAAQLPAYTTSLHRYLHLRGRGPGGESGGGAGGKFIPVTAGAPEGPSTVPAAAVLQQAFGGRPGLVGFNPGGGLLLVRLHGDWEVEPFLDLLGGGPADASADPSAAAAGLGRGCGRMAVRRAGGQGGAAVGDLPPEAARPRRRGVGGPLAGGAGAAADAEPGAGPVPGANRGAGCGAAGAVDGRHRTWPTPATRSSCRSGRVGRAAKFFLPGRPAAPSVYRPVRARPPAQGQAGLRVDRLVPGPDGTTVVEGSLVTQERFEGLPHDLVRLRACLDGSRVDLYARFDAFEPQPGAAPPRWRFRTLGRRLDPTVAARLRAAEGAVIPGSPFEVVPVSSTPSDLYALGVLAVRALVVNHRTTLPAALDEVLALARQVADEHDESAPLRLRVRAAFESDPRRFQSLGPHRLSWEDLKPQQAFDLLPPELWWDVLALLVRMFPGVGPDSACKDFGDAPAGALHQVFDVAAEDLRNLLVRSRSLIAVDWRYNREVGAVIRAYLSAADGAVGQGGRGRARRARRGRQEQVRPRSRRGRGGREEAVRPVVGLPFAVVPAKAPRTRRDCREGQARSGALRRNGVPDHRAAGLFAISGGQQRASGK